MGEEVVEDSKAGQRHPIGHVEEFDPFRVLDLGRLHSPAGAARTGGLLLFLLHLWGSPWKTTSVPWVEEC